MNDLEDLEADLRRMLERRAADIDTVQGSRPGFSPNPYLHRPLLTAVAASSDEAAGPAKRRWLAAAAVAVLAMVGLAAFTGRTTVDRIATAVSGDDEQAPEPTSTTDPSPGDNPTDAAGDPDGPNGEPVTYHAALASAVALLPAGFDPLTSPAVFVDHSTFDPDRAVRNYFALRGVVESPAIRVIPGPTNPAVYRWSTESGAGLVLVRSVADRSPEIVAVTTDSMAITELERTVDELTVLVDADPSTSAEIEIRTVSGERVGPVQPVDGANRTAAVAAGPVVLTVVVTAVEPDVAIEFTVAPVAFEASCGTEPPVTIEVGAMAGPLVEGPIIDDMDPPLANQQVWHHPSTRADVEVRWPADPALIAALEVTGLDIGGEQRSWGIEDDHHGRPAKLVARSHAMLKLDRPSDDPCAVVQIAVDGDAEVADWWADALTAEWNFEYPLTIAELDPASLNDDPGHSAGGELIIGSSQVAAVPVIPEAGSCDGLPDAPPQTGPGSDAAYPDAESALAAFLDAGPHGDPPIARGGYTEITIDGLVVAYVVGDGRNIYTVIQMMENKEGWLVTGWTGSAC